MVMTIERNEADSHYRAGLASHQRGRLGEADADYRRCLLIDPAHFFCLQLMGVVAYQTNAAERAVLLIRRAIHGNPGIGDYHSNLAAALLDLDRSGDARASAERAIILKPDLGDAYVNLGAAWRGKKDLAKARRTGALGLRIQPSASGLNDFGLTLRQLDEHAAANNACRTALALAPNTTKVYHNLAMIQMDLGRLEAKRLLLRELRVAPASLRALRSLVELERVRSDDPWFGALAKFETDAATLRPEERIELTFALAKGYDDLGDKERSFAYQLEGNRLKRARLDYDEGETLRLFTEVRRCFTKELLAGLSDQGIPSSQPIFIVGLPRSGTTLVEQILATHPDVYGAGELPHFSAALDGAFASAGLAYPEQADHPLARGLATEIGARYLTSVGRVADIASRFTDKMPGNLLHAGMIHLALPRAKIVLVRRDPIDISLSCFSKLFAGNLNFTYDLGELGRYVRASLGLMEYWESLLPSQSLVTIHYEALVDDFVGQARRLLDFCDLPWTDQIMAFHRTERAVRTASVTQVRQPIYRGAVGRWRPDPSVLAPLLAALQ